LLRAAALCAAVSACAEHGHDEAALVQVEDGGTQCDDRVHLKGYLDTQSASLSGASQLIFGMQSELGTPCATLAPQPHLLELHAA
jgi:hypothetical protein